MFMAVGTAYSLENIETILGIIILCIQIIWLVSKLFYKLYLLRKNKATIEDVGNEVNNTVKQLQNIKNDISKGCDENGHSKQEE